MSPEPPAPAPATPSSDEPSEQPAPRPPPPRPRSPTAVVVLATLAVGFTLWAAQELILPILLAAFFALVGNPIIRGLQRLYMPRFIGAVVVLIGGLAAAGALGNQLIEPAGEWVRQVPREMKQIAPKLRDLAKPMLDANKAAQNIARAAGGESTSRPVQVIRTELNEPYKVLTATPRRTSTSAARP